LQGQNGKMIDPKELRLGNLINYEGNVQTITQVSKHGVDWVLPNGAQYSGFKRKELQPILLTEEWLIKFDYEVDKLNFGECICNHSSKQHKLYKLENTDGYFDEVNNEYEYGIPLKFVHQFQNRFFSITGTELEIKTQKYENGNIKKGE